MLKKSKAKGFCVLTAEEVDAISGSGSFEGGFITVTGNPFRQNDGGYGGGGGAFGGGSGDSENNGISDHQQLGDGGGFVDYNSPEECSDHESGDGDRPEGFDPAMDVEIDRQASDLADKINDKPDSHIREYSAIVWRDSNGDLHSTGVHSGSETRAPLDAAWSQVDFANGGQVVAILHSHPTHFDSGNGIVPIASDNLRLSNEDFDQLLDHSGFNELTSTFDGAGTPGIDSDNYRPYIVTAASDGANVKEFYASDQDASQYGQSDSVTVDSEASDDYDQNTSDGSPC